MTHVPHQQQHEGTASAVTPLRVLFIDDEPALARLASRALPLNGIEVEAFTDPDEALRRYEDDPAAFDLVVTDHAMGATTGIEVIARLRRTTPDLPIVLTSGYLNTADRAEAERHGIRAFLQKPATISELISVVTAAGGR